MKRRRIPESVAIGILLVLVIVIVATVVIAWLAGEADEAQKTLRDIVLILGGALGGGAVTATAMNIGTDPTDEGEG